MEESSMMQGAQGMLVQNWPTVSSAAGEWKRTRSLAEIWIILISKHVHLLLNVADLFYNK